MAIVSWNARGLNSEEAIRQARLLTRYYKPDVLVLMETKLEASKVSMMCNKLGFEQGFEIPRVGLRGGLMILWKEMVEASHLTSSTNLFSCFIRWENQP